jgi:hypothetical protein
MVVDKPALPAARDHNRGIADGLPAKRQGFMGSGFNKLNKFVVKLLCD